MDAVTRLLADLVAIPSVNPMGRSLTGPGYLEGGMTTYLEGWFRERGVTEIDAAPTVHEDVVFRLPIELRRPDRSAA